MTDISILMPSYNYNRFITDAIDSVLAQETHLSHETIIQDGLSTDGTVEGFKRRFTDPRIKLLSESDGGQSDALNKALARSSGAMIGWLNADEFYMPGAFEAVRKAAEEHPEADVFIGDCIFVDEQGRFLRLRPTHKFSMLALRSYGCFISSCATFMRRGSLSDVPWDTSLRRSMDWDLWLSLGRKHKFHYIPQPLAAFRVHSSQVTNVPESEEWSEFVRLATKHGFVLSSVRKFTGGLLHKTLKLLNGAYFRQLKFRLLFSGQSLLWWEEPIHQQLAIALGTQSPKQH
jgi:glycosyltransferase involved in cell wall biosynthesis